MAQFDGGKSNNIHWARYDEATRTLEVDFRNAKTGAKTSTYAYDEFPMDSWMRYQEAESKGKFFAFSIRPKFKGRKIG